MPFRVDLELALRHRAQVEEFRKRHRTGLVTLIFTDVVGSTNIKQSLGDVQGVALIQQHRTVVRETLRCFNECEEIETAGDSFFIVFVKPSDAVKFSLLLQARLREIAHAASHPVQLRIGIHIGEVVIEEHEDQPKPKDLYGIQVDICARVMGLAIGDQILLTRSVSDSARQVIRGDELQGLGNLSWLNHGPYRLKGIEEPIEICEVGELGKAALKLPGDSEKALRLPTGGAHANHIEQWNQYRERLLRRFSSWRDLYTPMEIDPLISVVGTDLRRISNSEQPLSQALVAHQRLVLIGEPGAGKSTSLRYVAQQAAASTNSSADRNQPSHCVYLELSRFRQNAAVSPLQSLISLIAEETEITVEPGAEGLSWLGQVPCLFLFDGLNEVASEARGPCHEAIALFAERFPEHRIVVTTRPYEFIPFTTGDWAMVALRYLTDEQVQAFVRRYTDERTAAETLQEIVQHRNPLLRLPLFLSVVVQLRKSNLPDLNAKLGSYSGLISCYINYLIQRDATEKRRQVQPAEREQCIRGALRRLSMLSYRIGQSMRINDAVEAVRQSSASPASSILPEELIGQLCESGFLVREGPYLRFWHHTLQEYFLAGVAAGPEPRSSSRGRIQLMLDFDWLSGRRVRLLREDRLVESLKLLPAHLGADEMRRWMRAACRHNVSLAASWADDLASENECPESVDKFVKYVKRCFLRSKVFSIFGDGRTTAALRLILFAVGLSFMIKLAWYGVAATDAFRLTSIHTSRSLETVTTPALLLGVPAGHTQWLDRFFIAALASISQTTIFMLGFLFVFYIGFPRLQTIWGEVINLRCSTLRARFAELSRHAARSITLSKQVRSMVGILQWNPSQQSLVQYLEKARDFYISLRMLGYVDRLEALAVLQEIVKWRNVYSHAALHGLRIRLARFPAEKDYIINSLSELVRSKGLDFQLRRLTARVMKSAGLKSLNAFRSFLRHYLRVAFVWIACWYAVNASVSVTWWASRCLFTRTFPSGYLVLNPNPATFIGRPQDGVALDSIAAGSWLETMMQLIFGLQASWEIGGTLETVHGKTIPLGEIGPTLMAMAGLLGFVAIVGWQARRLGARHVRGYLNWDALPPWIWEIATLLSPLVTVPMLILNRNRIGRNALPIDWKLLEQAAASARENASNRTAV